MPVCPYLLLLHWGVRFGLLSFACSAGWSFSGVPLPWFAGIATFRPSAFFCPCRLICLLVDLGCALAPRLLTSSVPRADVAITRPFLLPFLARWLDRAARSLAAPFFGSLFLRPSQFCTSGLPPPPALFAVFSGGGRVVATAYAARVENAFHSIALPVLCWDWTAGWLFQRLRPFSCASFVLPAAPFLPPPPLPFRSRFDRFLLPSHAACLSRCGALIFYRRLLPPLSVTSCFLLLTFLALPFPFALCRFSLHRCPLLAAAFSGFGFCLVLTVTFPLQSWLCLGALRVRLYCSVFLFCPTPSFSPFWRFVRSSLLVCCGLRCLSRSLIVNEHSLSFGLRAPLRYSWSFFAFCPSALAALRPLPLLVLPHSRPPFLVSLS